MRSSSSESSLHDPNNNSDDDDDDSEHNVQVRVTLTLSSTCSDRSLEVGTEAIAVPADTGRRGLTAVINHLLHFSSSASRREKDDDDDASDRHSVLPSIPFDFVVDSRRSGGGGSGSSSSSQRLLRTTIEKEARRSGLTLEEAIPITYFPSQSAPEPSGESDPVPDWISAMSFVAAAPAAAANVLCTGCYDGSIVIFQQPKTATATTNNAKSDGVLLQKMVSKAPTKGGDPIKCIATASGGGMVGAVKGSVWIATGSMDHTLQIHALDTDTFQFKLLANCVGGHNAAVNSVDFLSTNNNSNNTSQLLASGDWDGALCIWNCNGQQPVESVQEAQPVKKKRTGIDSASDSTSVAEGSMLTLGMQASIRAHTSKISGLSWGNFEKRNGGSSTPIGRHLISGSWDHSLKVWDVDRQDCLLTLNGSRVVSCLDTSYHSTGIVATGHPDCTVRLWDVRTGGGEAKESSNLMTTNSTFKPSHREWISAVQWSAHNPYHLASTSHDGKMKIWDIRSTLPLHTVQAFGTNHKGLSLAYGGEEDHHGGMVLFVGGTDCVVKQFRCAQQPR
jgi:ribosome biogenesis protein